MTEYRILFYKTVTNDVGANFKSVQASIEISRAKTRDRALRAAQMRFERLKRTPHWNDVYADSAEIVPVHERA